jgi:CelD/BcsL family acetyltransferase involved in cellulose biosynthesis
MTEAPQSAEVVEGRTGPAFVRLPVADPRWSGFVERQPEASAFHQPAWADVLAGSYGLSPFVLARSRAGGELVAGMPLVEVHTLGKRRWVSLPFSDVCPPLGSPFEVEAMIAALPKEMARQQVDGVEIRSSVSSAVAHRTVRGVTHALALTADPVDLLPTFSRSQVQRNIARARREGVVVRRGEQRDDLLETFFQLHLLTRRRQGLLVQPRRFFECLWQRMIEPGHGFVLVSVFDDRPAAAAVFLLGGRTVTYKYGASDPRLWPRRPNHLLFWESIRWSCEHRYEVFDFGRSDIDNQGLRAFKGGWGTNEAELVYSVFGTKPLRPPEALVEAIGPVIRLSPLWANRALGRALYRLAA